MQPIDVGDVQPRELRAHGRHLGVVETHGLEVGQAPGRVAQSGVERQRPPIGLRRLAGAVHRPQGVAVVQPQLRLAREFGQQALVQRLDLRWIAHQRQAGGQEVAVGRIGRVDLQQAAHMGERLLGLLLLEQGVGVGEPRTVERRIDRQSPLQHRLGLGLA